MKKITLLIFVLSLSLLKTEIDIEKVLETESISEYNRWVEENKSKYPEIEPIYFQIKQIKDGKYQPDAPRTFNSLPEHPSTDIYEIEYYDENGNILNKEEISGYLKVFPLENKYSIPYIKNGYFQIIQFDYPNAEFTLTQRNIIKNKRGEIVFYLEEEEKFYILGINFS